MSEWHLVGGDPARGDPGGVRRLAQATSQIADAAHDAQMGLQNVGGDVAGSIWEGDAAEAFEVAFEPLAPDLGLMASSYYRVSEALRDYARDLDEVQARARQAVTRAQLAKSTADQARPLLETVRQQVRSLARQMTEVAADVRHKSFERTVCTDPAQASIIDDAIWRSRQYHGRLQRALGDAQAHEGRHQRTLDEAERSLDQQRSLVRGLHADHLQAEKRAAARIRSSLEQGLRNKSNLEKGLRLAVDVVSVLANPAAHLEELVDQAVVLIHQALERLSELADIAFVICVLAVVVLAVATLVTGGAAAPLLLLAIKATIVVGKVAHALDKARMVTTLYLAANDVRDPSTGERMVTWADAAEQGTKLVIISRLGKIGKPFEKRFVFPDARYATSAWRTSVRTLRPGRAFTIGQQAVAGMISVGIDKALDLPKVMAGTYVRTTVQRAELDLRAGRCEPLVGPLRLQRVPAGL